MVFEDLALRSVSRIHTQDFPYIDKDYSLAEALHLMDKKKTDRVVLSESGVARGILTLRDVIFKLGTIRTKQAAPSALHASSFMSEPLRVVKESDTLLKAATIMVEGGFTSVPVVGDEGVARGIISRWELAKVLRESPEAADLSVREFMRTPPVSVSLQTRILHVRQLIQQYDLSVIPVMDEGVLVGVIGVDEIARVFIKYYELARGEPKRITPLKYIVVADAIKLRPPKVDPESSLAEAADSMIKNRYRAVIIEDRGKPVGIITGYELAIALSQKRVRRL